MGENAEDTGEHTDLAARIIEDERGVGGELNASKKFC